MAGNPGASSDPIRPVSVSGPTDEIRTLNAVLIYAIQQLGGSLSIAGFEFDQLMLRTGHSAPVLELMQVRDPYRIIIRVREPE